MVAIPAPPPTDSSTAEISSWVLEHLASRIPLPASEDDPKLSALYSRLFANLATHTLEDSSNSHTIPEWQAALVAARKALLEAPDEEQLERVLLPLQGMELDRRKRLEELRNKIKERKERRIRRGKATKPVTEETDSRVQALEQVSRDLESHFEDAVFALKQRLIIHSIHATPHSAARSIALLNALLPIIVATTPDLQAQWTVPVSKRRSHLLRVRLFDLIDQVDEHLAGRAKRVGEIKALNRPTTSPRKRQKTLPTSPLFTVDEEREMLLKFEPLRAFDAELTWEKAVQLTETYLDGVRTFCLQIARYEPCPDCNEAGDPCPGLGHSQTVLEKIFEELYSEDANDGEEQP